MTRNYTGIQQQIAHGVAYQRGSTSSSPFVDMRRRKVEGAEAASGRESEERGAQKGPPEHAAEHGRTQLDLPHNHLQQPYLLNPETIRQHSMGVGKPQMLAGYPHEPGAVQAALQTGRK